MKVIVLLSMVLATALALPNNYGKVEETRVRIETPVATMLRRSSYESLPVRSSSYNTPVVRSSYTAPMVRTSYEVPILTAPVVRSYGTSYGGGYGEKMVETKTDVTSSATPVPILKFDHHEDNNGSYKFDFKTGNGITETETGTLKEVKDSTEGAVIVKSGSYSFTAPDGKLYTVNWIADENGFRATGDHLPTPPPIPEEIQKSLALPRIEEFQDHHDQHGEVKAMSSGYGGYSSSYSAPAPAVRSGY